MAPRRQCRRASAKGYYAPAPRQSTFASPRIADTARPPGVYSAGREPCLINASCPCGWVPSMNQPLLVTLVDPDPKGLATLAFGFEKERFTVAGTSDLRMAHQLVQSTGSRLAVVALRPPEPRGLALIGELARGPTLQRPAVLALGPAAARRAALDAGAADFIETPAFVRDVVLAGRVWLQARVTVVHREGGPEVTGSLDAWHGLYYVMRAMSATGRSGVLQLVRG